MNDLANHITTLITQMGYILKQASEDDVSTTLRFQPIVSTFPTLLQEGIAVRWNRRSKVYDTILAALSPEKINALSSNHRHSTAELLILFTLPGSGHKFFVYVK